jgi:hypothetical protein
MLSAQIQAWFLNRFLVCSLLSPGLSAFKHRTGHRKEEPTIGRPLPFREVACSKFCLAFGCMRKHATCSIAFVADCPTQIVFRRFPRAGLRFTR